MTRKARTEEHIKNLSASVKAACNDPDLRKHLDDQKRLSSDVLSNMVSTSKSKWKLLSDLSDYQTLTTRNFKAACEAGHVNDVSINDIVQNVRCRTCVPTLRGKHAAATKSFATFMTELISKRNQDDFEFDESTYVGISRPMSIKCNTCGHEFKKPPKQLVYEKFGCPKCALQARSDTQARPWRRFLREAKETHGDAFTYHKEANRDNYGNSYVVDRTCNTCNTRELQSIASHLGGNGCKTCSGMRKHTTESFVALSKKIWGLDQFDYTQVTYVNNKVPVTLKCTKSGHEFQCAPSNHFSKRGCPHCSIKKFVSAGETEWLDSLRVPKANRNPWINVNGQKFNVDGLMGMTIYEYYGDFWHGNCKRFPPTMINKFNGLTMQELYDHTIVREQLLREGGYVVITMWEQQWMQLRKTRKPIA